MILIRLKRSCIGKPQKQRRIIKGLGLRKINQEVIRIDTVEVRGMIRKVSHLLEVGETKVAEKK